MKCLNKVLHSCSVFDKIPEEKYPNILHCLQAPKKEFKKDEAILNIGETSQMAGIILSGIVELAFFNVKNKTAIEKPAWLQGHTGFFIQLFFFPYFYFLCFYFLIKFCLLQNAVCQIVSARCRRHFSPYFITIILSLITTPS